MGIEIEDRAIAQTRMNASDGPASEKYNDAAVMAPFDPASIADIQITTTVGANKKSFNWVPQTTSLLAVVNALTQHQVGPKDGRAIVFADMAKGQRLKRAVRSCTAIGLDLDTGISPKVVLAALRKFGCFAVCYTTHSHMTTDSQFPKDKITGLYPDDEIDSELLQRFVREEKHWEEAIASTVVYEGVSHPSEGIMVRVSHDPMPKLRVVVFLKEPFEIAKEGKNQNEAADKWAKRVTAFAEGLALPLDKSCLDPSRLFYAPRHEKGKPHSIYLFPGPLLDWRSIKADDEYDALVAEVSKGSGKSVTDEGKALGKWSSERASGFQIMNVIEDFSRDKCRGGKNIECANEAMHSNAGDPDDTACMAANAGDIGDSLFVVKCHHDSCRKWTMLDHLGRMLRDKWFPESVLYDPRYDIEERPSPLDKPRAELAKLSAPFSMDKLRPVLESVAKARVDRIDEDIILNEVKKKTKVSLPAMRIVLNRCKQRARPPEKQEERTQGGQQIFSYENAYHFDEATDFCKKIMLTRNKKLDYPALCRIDGAPVEMVVGSFGQVEFNSLTQDAFWSRLTETITFVKNSLEGGPGAREKVPEDVSKYLLHHAKGWLPEAPEVCSTPRFLKSGDLIISPGYHFNPILGLNHYIQIGADEHYDIPEAPTLDDVRECLNWLRIELLDDFSFNDPGLDGKAGREAAEANAIAMLVTPFMRPLFDDITPLTLILKAESGEGATLLARLPSLIDDGNPPNVTRLSKDEEDFAKVLISSVRSGSKYIFFDDILEINHKGFHRNITSPTISDRLLGGNVIVSVKNTFNWIATAINPSVKEESARRILPIRLNCELPEPEQREFRHPGVSGLTLEQFILKNRVEIVSRILTLIQYWINLDMPIWEERTMRSFSNWAKNVGGLLHVCGIEGFLNHAKLTSFDPERAALNAFAQESFEIFQLGDMSLEGLLKHHRAIEAPILLDCLGKGEAEVPKRFMEKLLRIANRTFLVETRDKDKDGKRIKQSFVFRMVIGADHQPSFKFEPAKKVRV